MRGLLATILGASDGGASPPGHGARNWGGDWGGGARSKSGVRVTPELAMNLSTVYGCVNLLAKTVGSLPILMYKSDATGKLFEAPEHPLYTLLQYQPNRWQTAFDFRAMLMSNLVLRGNGYAEIIPGPRGAVDQLEPIHPDCVSVERLPDKTLRYQVNDQFGRRTLLQDEMFHIRSPVAPQGLVGVGCVHYARETIGLALAAEEHGARMFANGVRPSGVLQLPKGTKLSDDAYARLKADFSAQYGGLRNAGKTPVLEDGAEFKPVSLTADEVQFLSTRQFQVEEVCRWFDIPPVMLHHTTNSTSWGTGVEAVMIAFVRNTLKPWLTAWEQAMRRDLILVPGVYRARFDTEDLQRGDSAAMAAFYQKLTLSGILVPNEAREALGYNPTPGGDERLIPVNMTTFDNMPDHSVPPPPDAGTGTTNKPDDGADE